MVFQSSSRGARLCKLFQNDLRRNNLDSYQSQTRFAVLLQDLRRKQSNNGSDGVQFSPKNIESRLRDCTASPSKSRKRPPATRAFINSFKKLLQCFRITEDGWSHLLFVGTIVLWISRYDKCGTGEHFTNTSSKTKMRYRRMCCGI